MKTELLDQIEVLKSIWMIGGSALEKSPVGWRECINEDTSPDVALVTIVGQAIPFALQPMPEADLKFVPCLPHLRLPPPPQPARQQICNLVRIAKLDETQWSGVIRLLAARGYTVHPIDYLPKSFSKLPDLYGPWELWLRTDQSTSEMNQSTIIETNDWNHLSPGERRQALSELRKNQPAASRDWILQITPSLPADERLRVLEILKEGLCLEDQDVLESFSNDRSSKVQNFAHKMLARLGVTQDRENEIAEFADFFSVTTKLFSHVPKIAAKPLKNESQIKRRNELSTSLSLHSFARGLSLSSEDELINGWEHVDAHASDILVQMVAATGSENSAALLASRIFSLNGISAEAFQQLFERLGKASRIELLPRVLQSDDASFVAALTCCQEMLGEVPWDMLEGVPALKRLKKLCMESSSMNAVQQSTLRQGLYSIGLVADRDAAGRLLLEFSQEKMATSDPMLGILKLNHSLPPGGNL